MKSLVYSLDGEVKNEQFFYQNGYGNRFYNQKDYNQIINKIYNDDNVNNDQELINYLITRPTADAIVIAYKLLSIDFVRNDREIFNALKKCDHWKQKAVLNSMERVSNQNINLLKQLFLSLPYMKGEYNKFCEYFCSNENFNYEIQQTLLKLSMKYWTNEIEYYVKAIVNSKQIADKKKSLMYIYKINDIKTTDGLEKLRKICNVMLTKEDILNDDEEMDKLISIANNNDLATELMNYCKIYDIPEVRTNREMRDYLFKILNDPEAVTSYDPEIWKFVQMVLSNEEVRNNNTLFQMFLKSNNFDMCYVLKNVFSCKELVSNEQMMSLILKMPNSWCLEQLLLAYETKEINHDIEILTNIASLAPFSDKMEDARLSYGVNEFELEWIDRKIEYARKKDDYIQIEERDKIRKLTKKKLK